MEIRDVFVIEEAVADLENGRLFYEEMQPGMGNYFWDTLLSDLESLIIYGGIYVKEMGFHRMLSKRFPYVADASSAAHHWYSNPALGRSDGSIGLAP